MAIESCLSTGTSFRGRLTGRPGPGRLRRGCRRNVAPPPMSVRRLEVVALTLRPPGEKRFHQMPGAIATPGRTVSRTRARASNVPRSLNTRTGIPSTMLRAAASSGCKSISGSPADARSESMFTNVEFRKCGDGGESNCSGNRAANSGAESSLSAGGMWVASGSKPCAANRAHRNSQRPLGVGKRPSAKGVCRAGIRKRCGPAHSSVSTVIPSSSGGRRSAPPTTLLAPDRGPRGRITPVRTPYEAPDHGRSPNWDVPPQAEQSPVR